MVGSREARCTGRVRSAEGAMHGQVRSAEGVRVEAPKARCRAAGRVRSVSDSYVHPNPDSSIPETTS